MRLSLTFKKNEKHDPLKRNALAIKNSCKSFPTQHSSDILDSYEGSCFKRSMANFRNFLIDQSQMFPIFILDKGFKNTKYMLFEKHK